MKKAIVFLANGFEEMEALGTVDILRRGGIEVTTVSITTGTIRRPSKKHCSDNTAKAVS